ncbi:MAG: hypothetical protein WC717_05955, partial [Candidatus Micrarchaeia archaeon]
MVAFAFDALYFTLLVFLSAIIPGVALGWPILRKSGLGTTEKALLCLFLGLFAAPALLYIEGLAGIKFSLSLVFINMLAIVAAGVFWGIRGGAFSFKLPEIPKLDENNLTVGRAMAIAVPVLLLLAMLLGFWIRIQPYSPVYSELDPYFYIYGSGQIIREGAQPLTDDSAWWPEIPSTHIGQPLKKYLEAEWFALYTNGGEYDNYVLFTTSSWLPPISAAFVCFGAYLLVSSIYGRRYGLLAAYFLAFLPITIYKMSAGVNEASPVGMMMLFVSMGVFAQAIVRKEKPLYLFSAFAFFATVAGSTFFSVLALPFAGLAILQSLDYFVRGKANFPFVEACCYAFAGFLIAIALQAIYMDDMRAFLAGPLMMALAGAVSAAVAYYAVGKLGLGQNRRLVLVGAAMFAALLLFFFTPAGGFVKDNFLSYVGAVEFKTALERTIAEQNVAGESFEGEAGFLALVPQNHIAENASGLGILSNLLYGILSVVSAVFTLLGNLLFRLFDLTFNLVAGISQTTSTKEDSLLFVFLIISSAGLALRHFTRKDGGREVPSVMILVLAFMLPVLYVGANKIKFTIFAGVAIAIAASVAMGELEKLFRWLSARAKFADGQLYVAIAFSLLLIAMVYAQAAGPIPYGYIFMLKSFEPRYQDNPAAMASVASRLCEDLRAKGVPYSQMQQLC